MELKSNPLMEKLASLKNRPATLTGYVLADDDKTFRLYPRLDPGSYYVVERSCVLDVTKTKGTEDGHVTVLVDADCQIEFVSQQSGKAPDLEHPAPRLAARIPIEGHDSLANACRALRQSVDDLLAEYRRDGTSGARREEIISELRNIASDWRSIGCQDAFGDIVMEIPRPRPGSEPVTIPEDVGVQLPRRSVAWPGMGSSTSAGGFDQKVAGRFKLPRNTVEGTCRLLKEAIGRLEDAIECGCLRLPYGGYIALTEEQIDYLRGELNSANELYATAACAELEVFW